MSAGEQLQLALPTRSRAAPIPASGTIVGGEYHGCSYLLLRVRHAGHRRFPFVRVAVPNWPFPRELEIRPPARLQP